jgi:hypothetical protein
MKDDAVLVVIMWNEAPILKLCIRLSRIIARYRKISLPEDFMAIYLNEKECKNMFEEAGFNIKEKIISGALYGALEANQYITMGKYTRSFGSAEKQYGKIKNQSIYEDLIESSKGGLAIKFLYFIAKYFPSLVSMYSLYILEKK